MIILIDGPSGAGKTTLATELSRRCGWPVVSLDDIYPGWDGLAAGSRIVAQSVLDPHQPGYVRWDWENNRAGAWVPVQHSPGLIIEGVGAITTATVAAARRLGEVTTVLVDAPRDLRRQRALTRDPSYAPYWERWEEQERAHFDALGEVPIDHRVGAAIFVSAVIFRDKRGRVLAERKRGTLRFMLPGGKPEPGESGRECAVREVREELGLALDPRRLRALGRHTAAAANEAGAWLVCDLYEWPEALPARPSPSREIAECRWDDPCATTLHDLAPLSSECVYPRLCEGLAREAVLYNTVK